MHILNEAINSVQRLIQRLLKQDWKGCFLWGRRGEDGRGVLLPGGGGGGGGKLQYSCNATLTLSDIYLASSITCPLTTFWHSWASTPGAK